MGPPAPSVQRHILGLPASNLKKLLQFSCKAGLLATPSLGFHLPAYCTFIFFTQSYWVLRLSVTVFSFNTLNMPSSCLLASSSLVRTQLLTLPGSPWVPAKCPTQALAALKMPSALDFHHSMVWETISVHLAHLDSVEPLGDVDYWFYFYQIWGLPLIL